MNNKDDFKTGYDEKNLEKDVNFILDFFYSTVKEMTPVKTGNLKNSWRKTKEEVINDCEYCDEVNDGTRYKKPRRFIERAYAKTLSELEKKSK